jgi:hypothetical protein
MSLLCLPKRAFSWGFAGVSGASLPRRLPATLKSRFKKPAVQMTHASTRPNQTHTPLNPLSTSPQHETQVRPPTLAEVGSIKAGARLVSYVYPAREKEVVAALAERKATVIGAGGGAMVLAVACWSFSPPVTKTEQGHDSHISCTLHHPHRHPRRHGLHPPPAVARPDL